MDVESAVNAADAIIEGLKDSDLALEYGSKVFEAMREHHRADIAADILMADGWSYEVAAASARHFITSHEDESDG